MGRILTPLRYRSTPARTVANALRNCQKPVKDHGELLRYCTATRTLAVGRGASRNARVSVVTSLARTTNPCAVAWALTRALVRPATNCSAPSPDTSAVAP